MRADLHRPTASSLGRAATRTLGVAAVVLASSLVGGSPADAAAAGSGGDGETRTAVYSAEGVRFEAALGRVDDLFPTSQASSSLLGEAPALAIDVVHPSGAVDRLLVPGTEGAETELEPTLLYEQASSTLFVLWRARGLDERSHLLFAALAEERFAAPISVTREAMVIAAPPTVAVTRESTTRTVVHLAWVADERAGTRSFYSPIVLFHGEYAGWNPVLDLGRLDPHPAAAVTVPSAVFHAGGVADGVDLRSVVLAAANDTTGHLLTVRSRVLPMGLVSFSDEARNHLIGVGGGFKRTTRELADAVATYLGQLEQEIHAGARAFLTRAARAFILEHAARFGSTEELASALRQHLLEAGASLLSQEFETAPQSCGLVEVGPDAAAQAMPAVHVLEVCRIRDRALPAMGGAEAAIHASRDGGLVLLTWRQDGALWFRLSEGAAWTEPRSIEAGGDVSLLWHSLGR